MNPPTSLSSRYPLDSLAARLLPRAAWQPYPPAFWQALPADLRQDAIAAGEQALATPWPHLPATLYLRFARDGDRAAFESPYFLRRSLLASLVLAERCQAQGRLVDALADAAWSICEESTWCLPAHVGDQRAGVGLPDVAEPVVDLFAAETAALLAWVHSLAAEQLASVSPLLPPRLVSEVQQRVLTPALQRDDFWWMGFSPRLVNNWNPWINSNWLAALLLLEDDEARRLAAVHKIMRSLDRFIIPYPADGGCDEGPSYWTRAGASLYDCLELLYSASAGQIDLYDDPKIQNIGRFIYRAHIAGDYYVNFADAPALVSPDAALVAGYGRRAGDPALQAFGAWLAARPDSASARGGGERDLGRALAALQEEANRRQGEPGGAAGQGRAARPPLPVQDAPLVGEVYLPDIQFFAAREKPGSAQGLYLAAKGGHNEESHNHNDVGHFIVYHDGLPLIVDAGVETYTRKTFSARRYEIWTMQSAYHSLPTMDGVMQSPGRAYAARAARCDFSAAAASFALDIAAAYPAEAHLVSWQRQLTLQRAPVAQVCLLDEYRFTQAPRTLTLSLLTPCQVDLAAPGQARLAASPLPEGRPTAAGLIHYDAAQFRLSVEEIPIRDARLGPVWGSRLQRLLFHVLAPASTGSWTLHITGLA